MNDLDLLGLGQGDLDLLGLGGGSVPVISSAPPDEGSFLGDLWDRFATDKEGEKAKAANALSLSEATGLPPSVVYDRMDEITQEAGLRDQPPFRDLIERPIMGAVTYGLLAHPMATVVGVASFGALAEAENYLVSRKEGIPYQFGAGRGLADMLPEETAQGYKDLIWTADMAWKAVAAGGAIKGAKPAVEKFAVKYMRDVTETYNLPRNVYISPEKIREFHGLGRENIISTEEASMLKEMGLTRQQYVDGLKYGLDLEIPAEKLVTMVDKPWWAAMKGLFKVSPYEETVVSRGKATGDKAVSGLLGEPEAAPKPAEFLTEQAATGTSPAEVGKVAAAEIVQPGANLKVIYHGTDKTFEEFDITKSADGSIWFTDNKSKIENGEVAATGKGIIVERLIDENNLKLGGWDEADKYSTDELISQGYDGLKLVDEEETTYQIFNPEKLKGATSQAMKLEKPSAELTIEESTVDMDDPNTLLEMAARSDEVAMPPQTTEYDKIRAQAASIAFENLSKKIDLKKRREASAIRRQGIEDARGVPVFAAMDEAIKGGGLNRGWLEKIYDREMVNELARKRVGLVTKDGPFGLDQIAQMHGYDYADTLMNDLLAWEGLKAEGVKAAETFEEKYYDLLSEAEKEDFHLALLEEEAKILRKMIKATGKPSTPGIKKVIREQTGQTRVEELTVSEYDALKAGMKKAEQASRKAFREGKIEGALAEKERQIEMAETRKAKLEAKEESKGIHDDIVRLTKDKSIPEDYRDRITSLLEDFDILPRSKKTAQRVESAREFLERQKQAGEDVTIPESMLNRIERYGKTHWRELTLDQLREIHDQAKMYEHLGKMKNKLLKARQKKDFEATVQGLIDEISKNWGIKQAGPADIEAMFLEPSALEGMGQFRDSYLGSLTKVETYLRRLDGFKDMGPVWERTYLPVKEASDAEYRNLADITGKLQKLFEPMKKTLTKEKFKIPGVNQFVTRETVIMVALNSGNEGNLNALKNTIYKWDDAQIQAILNNVTPDEWKLVRGVWDLFEEQFPKLSEVYKNLSGVNLKKVEGDYFPLVFDRKLSWIADKNATEQELRDFFKSIYTRPSVKSGSTIERVGGTLPPKLKFTVIFDKLAEINHYITHAEAVRDVQKILGDPRVRAAIEGTPAGIGGAVGYREMMTWLQDVARQKADPLSAVESAIKTARINTTAVAMAWKFSTAAVQWLGMGNSIYKLGMGEVAKGMAEFYTNREATVERIKGLSAEMAGRAKSFDRELRDAYNRIGLEHFRGSMALKDSFFSLISLMDMAVAYPTWLAAYNKGMKDYSDETKAVEFADMTVRMTQGSALAKDLAGIQRGSELKKIMSMFYTFFSAYHQMMSDAWLKFKFDKTGQNFSDFVKAWWWLTILPASMDYLMKERDVPSPGDFLKNVLQMRLTAYPVIRDLTGAVLTDYDYQFSPVARAGEVVARGAKEVVKLFTPGEEAELDKLLKYGIESAGYMFGLPTGQAVVTMQGLIDLMNGETSDPTRLMFRAPREEE